MAVYDPLNYNIYVTIGYLFALVALVFIQYLIETQVITQTKGIFTIISLILLGIIIITLIGITTRDFATFFMYLIMPISVSIIALMYIYIIIKSSDRVRNKAILVFLGIALILVAHLFDSENFIGATYPYFPLEFAPLLTIIGTVIYIYSNLLFKLKD